MTVLRGDLTIFLADISRLHAEVDNEDEFKYAASLFREKHEVDKRATVYLFARRYLDERTQQGAIGWTRALRPPGFSSDNNGLEKNNDDIKRVSRVYFYILH